MPQERKRYNFHFLSCLQDKKVIAMEEAPLQLHCINQICIYLKVYSLTLWNLLFLSGVLWNYWFLKEQNNSVL